VRHCQLPDGHPGQPPPGHRPGNGPQRILVSVPHSLPAAPPTEGCVRPASGGACPTAAAMLLPVLC
jgi:hypothetical protein